MREELVESCLGVSADFLRSLFSFFNLYEGVDNCKRCSSDKMLQELQSFLATHGSDPLPFSLQRAQKQWLSKLAMMWPQLPCFCEGEDMTIRNQKPSQNDLYTLLNTMIKLKSTL